MRAPDPFPPAVAAEVAAMDPADAELAALVRAARTRPAPDAARRLDARAARALAGPLPAPRRRRGRGRALLAPALALALCACLALVVVLGTRGDGHGVESGGGAGGGAASSAAGGSSAGAAAGVSAPSRAVERTTTLELATVRHDVDAAAAAAAQVATSLGGYVAASTVTSGHAATLQ